LVVVLDLGWVFYVRLGFGWDGFAEGFFFLEVGAEGLMMMILERGGVAFALGAVCSPSFSFCGFDQARRVVLNVLSVPSLPGFF
jgi:hypothetical protein